MGLLESLAFVDVETNGLSPTDHRIAEVGVVFVDEDRVERWTTFVKGGSTTRLADSLLRSTPAFADVARELARRLEGRLVVAHNARFDHAFLKAEFERAGVVFEPQVVCSLMLSRKLAPHLASHDLDALADAHGLIVGVRHRALPDAELLWQWWQRVGTTCDLESAVAELLAGPVLPVQLDPALVDCAPQAPGAYVFHDESGGALATGAAANLRAHVVDYFRLDRASPRALEFAHRIAGITWRVTRGFLGAQLHAALLARVHATTRVPPAVATWRFRPDEIPCLGVGELEARESFGLFASDRKAYNALARLAARRGLCHTLAGLPGDGCLACDTGKGCGGIASRKRHLMRVFSAIRPLRIQAWPYPGPIGIRERTDLHVIDRWQFLGTARDEHDARELLATRRDAFDKRMYQLLVRELPRVPRERIVPF